MFYLRANNMKIFLPQLQNSALMTVVMTFISSTQATQYIFSGHPSVPDSPSKEKS